VAPYARCVCTSPRGLGVLGLGELGFGGGLGLGLGLGVGLERRCVRTVRLHVAMQLRRLHLQPYASEAATACVPSAALALTLTLTLTLTQSNYGTEPEP